MTVELRQQLAQYFQDSGGSHGVEVAYLFGSCAKGTAGLQSDVDIAILFSFGLTKEERFDRQLAVAVELGSQVGREVDVVDLAASLRRYVERTLQLAIECCLDLGSHIISAERLREPEDNKKRLTDLEDFVLARCLSV